MNQFFKQIIIFFWVNFPLISFGQSVEISNNFIKHIQHKNYDSAYSFLNKNLAKKISPTEFQKVWKDINGIKDFEYQNTNKKTIYSDIQNYNNDELILSLTFDKQNKLSGIWIENKDYEFSLPKYANPTFYEEYDIPFGDKNFPLVGTLTIPKNTTQNYPLVILVHGSGPNDRDETIYRNKIFRDLALGLATKRIAVFRYDKRTYTHQDKIKNDKTFDIYSEVINDALAAIIKVRKEKYIDTNNIIVMGHSLGAMLAPLIAKKSENVSKIVMLAAPARKLDELLIDQMNYFMETEKLDSAEIANCNLTINQAKNAGKINSIDDYYPKDSLPFFNTNYFLSINNYNQVKQLQELKIPALIIQGKRDYQVTLKDYEIWQNELKNHPNVSFKLYDDLNHILMKGKGIPSPNEYVKLSHVNEDLINDIYLWILNN